MREAGLGVAALGVAVGCEPASRAPIAPPPEAPTPRGALDAGAATATPELWEPSFPLIEAAGEPEAMGEIVGRATADSLRHVLTERWAWLERLRAFAFADREARFTPFVAAAERHHPDVVAELRGIAAGANVPLDDLWLWNLQPELGTMISEGPQTGCSTLHLATADGLILAHNEDGDDVYHGRLALLHLRPTTGPSILCLHYPGQIAGQVPAITSAGLVMTTNFIATREVRPGVPRYVLGRAALTADSVDGATAIATNAERAFAFTLNLGSTRERRLVCCEVAPRVHDIQETSGLFLHTNHLVLPATRGVSQRDLSPQGSTGSRYEVLSRAARAAGDPAALTADDLTRMLTSHESVRAPFSPCRHPTESVSTRTLAAVSFDLRRADFTLFEGNPCERHRRELPVPS